MRVLPAILANARRIALDVTRIVIGAVERRREQQRDPVVVPDQMLADRIHRASRHGLGSAAPAITLHDCAIASILHSLLSLEPNGVPSS